MLPEPGDPPSIDTLALAKATIESASRLEGSDVSNEVLMVTWLKINAVLQYIALASDDRAVHQKILDAMHQ